jgi:hypothetical protein
VAAPLRPRKTASTVMLRLPRSYKVPESLLSSRPMRSFSLIGGSLVGWLMPSCAVPVMCHYNRTEMCYARNLRARGIEWEGDPRVAS